MPKKSTPLTDEKLMQAETGNKPRKLSDGGGLYVEISPSGSKIWCMKFSDANGKESRLTFGAYPEVSLEIARNRRSDAHHLLKQGLDPRRDFNHAKMRPQMCVGERRLLPISIDKRKVASHVAQIGREAVEQIEALVFPSVQRLFSKQVSQAAISELLEKIRRTRRIEVDNLLYDICVEIAWSCIDLGLGKDELIEAMTDARVRQRRWH